jgi:tripartite-type tricarboxylate transporter receptor subunit TctC
MKKLINRRFVQGLAALLGTAFSLAAVAADFPDRTIRLIVPFAAGGPTDVVARAMAKGMSEQFKQPVVVDNRPGATGLIATQAVMRAEPDGHTILVTSASAHITSVLGKTQFPFHPVTDFAPIGRAVQYPLYLVANPKLPAKTLPELFAHAKRSPKPLVYASVGVGSLSGLACELMASAAGVELIHSPYKGAAPAAQAVMSGEADLMCDSVPGSQAWVRDGRLRGLAIMGAQRSPQAAGVPTTAEAGYPGVETYVWLGLLAPAKTPPAVVDRLNKALHNVLKSPAFEETAKSASMDIIYDTPSAFAASMRTELDQWSRIVKAKNITTE